MRCCPLLMLLALAGTSGCANPHLKGPVVKAHPGSASTISEVPYDATYSLVRTDKPGEPIYATRLFQGESVGFRREPDGSIAAVAAGMVQPLDEGCYSWVVDEDSAPTWRERATQDWRRFGAKTAAAIGVAGVVVAALAIIAFSI